MRLSVPGRLRRRSPEKARGRARSALPSRYLDATLAFHREGDSERGAAAHTKASDLDHPLHGPVDRPGRSSCRPASPGRRHAVPEAEAIEGAGVRLRLNRLRTRDLGRQGERGRGRVEALEEVGACAMLPDRVRPRARPPRRGRARARPERARTRPRHRLGVARWLGLNNIGPTGLRTWLAAGAHPRGRPGRRARRELRR